MKDMIGNGKTVTGGIAVGVSAILLYFGYNDLAALVGTLGGGTIAIGLGHKLQKVKNLLERGN